MIKVGKNDYFRVRLSFPEILKVSGLEFWKEFKVKQSELRKSHSISAVGSPRTYNTVVYLGRQDFGQVQGIPRKVQKQQNESHAHRSGKNAVEHCAFG